MSATTRDQSLPPPPPPGWEQARSAATATAAAAAAESSRSPTVRRWSRLGMAAGAAAVAGGCLYLALVDPNTSSAYPPCPLKVLTGWDCAGCGGLRATHALLTGDIVRAADHNLLVVAALPVLAYLGLRWAASKAGRQLPALPWHPAMTFVLMAVVLVYSVIRNVTWGPGPYLYSAAG